MKLIIFTLILSMVASVSYAEYYEDSKIKATISKSEINSDGTYTVSAKISLKHDRKKMKTEAFEDYVVNCETGTYHVENSTTYYNGNQIDSAAIGVEKKMDRSFSLKLKEKYCGLTESDPPVETCVKQVYRDEAHRRYVQAMNKFYGTVVCQ